jgi:hypothetical protein
VPKSYLKQFIADASVAAVDADGKVAQRGHGGGPVPGPDLAELRAHRHVPHPGQRIYSIPGVHLTTDAPKITTLYPQDKTTASASRYRARSIDSM